MIETFAIVIISVGFGAYLGSKMHADWIEEADKDVVNIGKSVWTKVVSKSDLTPGLIKRPTVQQVNEKKKPPEKKAADEAMKKTLSQIPEIEERRKQIEELHSEGVI